MNVNGFCEEGNTVLAGFDSAVLQVPYLQWEDFRRDALKLGDSRVTGRYHGYKVRAWVWSSEFRSPVGSYPVICAQHCVSSPVFGHVHIEGDPVFVLLAFTWFKENTTYKAASFGTSNFL